MPRLPAMRPSLPTAETRTARPAPKQRAHHYGTAEHRAWAAGVIAATGGACQHCGRSGGRLFADHVVELLDGGHPTDLKNGQALCGACHSRKTAAARAARHGRTG